MIVNCVQTNLKCNCPQERCSKSCNFVIVAVTIDRDLFDEINAGLSE